MMPMIIINNDVEEENVEDGAAIHPSDNSTSTSSN